MSFAISLGARGIFARPVRANVSHDRHIKRNNAIASRRATANYYPPRHTRNSFGQSAAFYYGRELLFSFREAEKYRLTRDSTNVAAFNRRAAPRAYLNEKGLLALLFSRSTTIRRFYFALSLERDRGMHAARVTLADIDRVH